MFDETALLETENPAKLSRYISLGTTFFLIIQMLFMLLAVQSFGSVQQKTGQEAAVLIAESRVLWQKGQQWAAIDTLKKAIVLNPGDPAAHTELAEMYLGVKSNDQARVALAEALRLDPKYAPAHHKKAILLRLTGDFEGAIREAKLALSLKPHDETAAYSHVTIGRSLMRLGRTVEADEEFRKAVAVYQKSLQQKPNDASVHVALGALLFELQRYDEAENSYRRALELNPQNFSTPLDLGSVLHNQGKKDEATRYYKEYLRLNPEAGNKANIEARIRWLETNALPTLLGHLLIHAAENGNVFNVRALLTKGADVNFKDNYKTPLNRAAREGYLEVVKVLLAQGAKDDDGAALAEAYEAGHSEIEKLLERAAPEPLSPKAVSRLLYAAIRKGDAVRFASVMKGADEKESGELLLYAVSQKKAPPVEIVRMLLDQGAKVNQPTQYKTALMHASSEGYAEVVSLLLARGAEVNAQTNEGTALMMAVTAGHTDIVRLLLAAGADSRATHRLGDQVLILAARQSDPQMKVGKGAPSAEAGSEIMELLLAKGADPNARGQWGRTALMYANSSARVNLLVARGADLQARDDYGATALMRAAERGEADVVSSLLSNGADVNATDQNGTTALLHSLNESSAYGEAAQELRKRRLEVARRILLANDVQVDAQNADGETALMRAVRLGSAETVKLLLSQGADKNRSDVFGDTAVILAYEKGNSEIEGLLHSAEPQRQPLNVLNAFLRAAIGKKDEAKVKELLAEGANPNHEYSIGYAHKEIKSTMLILAAKMGHPAIVQMLLDKGADVNAKGLIYGSERGLNYGTALEAAEFSQHAEVIKILRKAVNNTVVP